MNFEQFASLLLYFAFWMFIGLPIIRFLVFKSLLWIAKKRGIKLPPHIEQGPIIKVTCPPHKWDYDINGNMYCKQCPRKPGQ